jgi:hypothetical protein
MTFNAYITLDGKKYSTSAKNWQPLNPKPMTARQLANGDLDITYGAKCLRVWEGEILAYVTEARTGYGSSSDLGTSLAKLAGVTFVDHYGTSCTVHIQNWKARSLTNVWDNGSNKFYFMVRLIADA